MAKKMKRFLALVIALALCAGQIAVPAMAEEAEEDTVVEVTVELEESAAEKSEKEEPAAEESKKEEPAPEQKSEPAPAPQAPAPSPEISVTVEEPVTTVTHNESAGEIVESTSTTTTWTDTTPDDGKTVSGSETVTEFTATDDYNGSKLYEGGSIEGSETTKTTETTTVTETETIVTEEITTTEEKETLEEESTTEITEDSSTTELGQWDTTGTVTEGDFVAEEHEGWTDSITTTLGDGEIPEGGITIELTPDTTTKKENDYSGEVTGEVILLEETMEIPAGAELVKDKDGNVIGYKKVTESETITGTKEVSGKEKHTGTVTDTTADTSAVTPDLKKTNIPINDNSVITEEYDAEGSGKITAYVVTNTTEETITGEAIDAMERPADGTITLDNGNTKTITTEDVVDEAGNVIGFEARTVVTDANGKVIQDTKTTQTILKNDPPAPAAGTVTFNLPAKPAESTVTDENGNTTAVTVAEILDDNGAVIGYESITVITDAEGTELSRGSEKIYGTTEITKESVTVGEASANGGTTIKKTTVDTYRVTAEEAAYEDIATYTRLTNIVNDMEIGKDTETVMIDGKLYYIYTASMEVTEGKGHGDTSLMNPITPMGSLMKANSALDLETGNQGLSGVSSTKPAEGFKYIGSGVNTSLSINKGNSPSAVEQFRLISSDGKVYYAMCIDFNTTIKSGHLYDIEDIRNATYLQQSGNEDISAADKIRSVALNGYWGTESDVGSMADVKEFLEDYLEDQNYSEKQIKDILDSLTPGQAQAATQAALWMFGNKDKNNTVNTSNLVSNDNGVDETNTKHLFNALLAAANDADAELEDDEGVEFLDAEDITGGSITIKSKVISEDEAHVNNDDDASNDTYNTDIGFTLGIEPSKLNGDLIVTVNVGGKEVKKVRLAGADDPLLPMGRIIKNDDGSYTIPDVEVAEGVTINLNLSGTQDLGTGVYIYTSLDGTFNDSQTLVTLATGSRKVNLDMNMSLNVEEPTVTKTNTGETQYGTRTDERTDTRTDKIQRKETTTKSEYSKTVYESAESVKTYSADVTIQKVTTKEAEEERSWMSSWLKFFAPETEEHDGGDGNDEEEKEEYFGGDEDGKRRLTTLLDEDVPLADAPKTGDISALWAAISFLSLGGMAALSVKRKEEE